MKLSLFSQSWNVTEDVRDDLTVQKLGISEGHWLRVKEGGRAESVRMRGR